MNPNEKPYAKQLIKAIMVFLQMFMCETLVKRIISMMLLATGFSNERITELSGLCNKSVRTLKKSIEAGEYDSLFHVGSGGQKGKLSDIEASIIKEVNENDYHSQQQIADMVLEKFGMKVSQATISRLLKKTASNGLNAGHCQQRPT
jgi:transposase